MTDSRDPGVPDAGWWDRIWSLRLAESGDRTEISPPRLQRIWMVTMVLFGIAFIPLVLRDGDWTGIVVLAVWLPVAATMARDRAIVAADRRGLRFLSWPGGRRPIAWDDIERMDVRGVDLWQRPYLAFVLKSGRVRRLRTLSFRFTVYGRVDEVEQIARWVNRAADHLGRPVIPFRPVTRRFDGAIEHQ